MPNLAGNPKRIQRRKARLLTVEDIQNLCSDCPPNGYPNDATRCAPCPRRNTLYSIDNPPFDSPEVAG
jgi:hypothetical protein